MLQIQSDLEGKLAQFGYLQEKLKPYGFGLGGYWEYDHGYFDTILSKERGETIYLRLPFNVIHGVLDSPSAQIQFKTPYVIKHVLNLGLDFDDGSLLDPTGFSQFQTPIDKDGKIEDSNKWVEAGQQVVGKVLQYIN